MAAKYGDLYNTFYKFYANRPLYFFIQNFIGCAWAWVDTNFVRQIASWARSGGLWIGWSFEGFGRGKETQKRNCQRKQRTEVSYTVLFLINYFCRIQNGPTYNDTITWLRLRWLAYSEMRGLKKRGTRVRKLTCLIAY